MQSEPSPGPERALPRTPSEWLRVFGPGAVVASLTIGTGELIFSSRAGALFGHSVLWIFLLTVLLKWALVLGSARWMVLAGQHPFEVWSRLPGPRGWVPLTLALLTLPAFPVWVAFHAEVIGSLLTLGLPGERTLWALVALTAVLVLALVGGYRLLERLQIILVIILLGAALVVFVMLRPDLLEIIGGFLVPAEFEFPQWLAREDPELAAEPVWLELTRYVGVVGGGGFDYLAYMSFLREKGWGASGGPARERTELERVAADPAHPSRRWLRAVLVDSSLGFACVLVFSAVFVTCGRLVLGEQEILPGSENMLGPQARFFELLHPGFQPVYFLGAGLTLAGTLYGTLEVAPRIYGELWRAVRPAAPPPRWLRPGTLLLCGLGALGVTLALPILERLERRALLVELITPANLFTGVLCCGLICGLQLVCERRLLPRALGLGRGARVSQALAALAFTGVGGKALFDYLEHRDLSRVWVLALVGVPAILGLVTALILRRTKQERE